MLNGMSMMSPNGGGGGGGDDKPKRPSGMGHPAIRVPSDSKEVPAIAHPMPVVLTIGTIIKLASVVIVPLVGALSAGIYFVHKTNTHMENQAIHLVAGERPKLETKIEAVAARGKLESSIKREVKLQAREIKADVVDEQKVQIKKFVVEIRADQKAWGDRLLSELKKTRKDIKDQ